MWVCGGWIAVVRTLTGHRSNCVSVSFHPFGEFFASGSLDTNLKIWDIRRKGCIHTYKEHTRGINTIKFSPDGRWVVSGGEDNSVKVSLVQFFSLPDPRLALSVQIIALLCKIVHLEMRTSSRLPNNGNSFNSLGSCRQSVFLCPRFPFESRVMLK